MDEEADGLKIVLTPVQMAAIMVGDNIPEQATLTNRLWGTAKTVGGVLELMGAAALCLTPEPTGATKVGCVVGGIHGSDTTAAGLRQMLGGRPTTTLTEEQVAGLARALGASNQTADTIALAVEVAVPTLVAGLLGAIRIQSVRAGRVQLLRHEAQAGSKVGGHTIARHVGKTEVELRARLLAEPRVPAACSFPNLDVAERAVTHGLRVCAKEIAEWTSKATIKSRPQGFEFAFSKAGYGVVRLTNEFRHLSRVRIVLKYGEYNGMPYYILTAFPVP
jgi:hypothetical protein